MDEKGSGFGNEKIKINFWTRALSRMGVADRPESEKRTKKTHTRG
jgi:hypothetical protein